MNQEVDRAQRNRGGWLWKLPLGLAVLLLVCLAVAFMKVNAIAHRQINAAMKNYFVEGGSLDAIDIGLMAGRIELTGVTINPPKGHGSDPLLALGNLVLDVVPTSLVGDVMVVEKLTLKGMSLSLVRDKQGRLGLAKLLTAHKPADRKEESPDAPTQEQALPAVHVHKIRLEDSSINIRDNALTGKPMVFPLNDIRLAVDQLRLFDGHTAADPAAISLSFKLEQSGKLPPAYFGTVARMGPVDRDIPPTNAQVRLIGLKLDTLGSLLPPATRTALGADGLDSGLALSLNDGHISLDALALTDRNIRYDTVRVRGPLDAPEVTIAPVMAGVFRVTDGVLSIGKSGLAGGVSMAEGSVDVAKEAGSGALKIGKKLMSSLFDTGAGLVTLDGKQVKEGMVGSTMDTIGLSVDSVKGAGNAARDALGQSVSNLTGSTAAHAWDKGIPARYQTAMVQAQKALAKMPYPPVIK